MIEVLAYVFRDKKGVSLYSASPNRPMVPASNMKIVTGFVSSSLLGEEFEIRTEFRVLGDDLIVSGGPTPLLNTQDALNLRERFRDLKLKRVLFNGNLDEDLYAPGWLSDDQRECYQTRVTSFSLNENCVARSGAKGGKSVDGPHSGRKTPDIRPYDTLSKNLISEGDDDVFPLFDFTNTKSGKLILTHKENIGSILEHLEPISCNFSADSLFKFNHHHRTGKPGTWKGGSETMMDVLKGMNLMESGIRFVDGSGLSSLNRLTPSFLSNLLRRATELEGGKFLEHLPSPGSGTLEHRLDEFKDWGMRAKTGSLNGVATLSGHVKRLDVTFSMMLNGTEKKGREARDTLDETFAEIVHKIERKFNRK